MIGPGTDVRVYLAYDGAVCSFRGRRGDCIKLLFWDGQSFCLYYKVLERGQGMRSAGGQSTHHLEANLEPASGKPCRCCTQARMVRPALEDRDLLQEPPFHR